MGEFGLVSGLRSSLMSVRGADRDVKRCVGVAQSRGENVRRSQVSARYEPGDLHLSRAVTRLGSCVHQRGDSSSILDFPAAMSQITLATVSVT